VINLTNASKIEISKNKNMREGRQLSLHFSTDKATTHSHIVVSYLKMMLVGIL
jgi:hypothetical protein